MPLLFLLAITMGVALMVGSGIGKIRYEAAKWLRRRKIRKSNGLVELTPKKARKLYDK
jgi:hypothetical protein